MCEALVRLQGRKRGSEAASLLLDATKEDGTSALHLACARRQAEVVRALLALGALPGGRDKLSRKVRHATSLPRH